MKEATGHKKGGTRSAPQRSLEYEDATDRTVDLTLDDDGFFLPAHLEDFEKAMNANDSLRSPTNPSVKDFEKLYEEVPEETKALIKGMNTNIHVCPLCSERVLGSGAYQTHISEVHNSCISAKVDGGEETTTTATKVR